MSSLFGINVIESEFALVQAFELWDSTKNFCSAEFISQFNEWSLRTFGRKPGVYHVDTNYIPGGSGQKFLVIHPEIKQAILKEAEGV